ncbi:hypothetical protein G7Y79_00011g030730 [Physcia stellaris]|nr:hypothetical protein G7Y79_00011g030730 [Physcia stellaris]
MIPSEAYLTVPIFKDIVDRATAHLDTSQKKAVRLVLELAHPLTKKKEVMECQSNNSTDHLSNIFDNKVPEAVVCRYHATESEQRALKRAEAAIEQRIREKYIAPPAPERDSSAKVDKETTIAWCCSPACGWWFVFWCCSPTCVWGSSSGAARKSVVGDSLSGAAPTSVPDDASLDGARLSVPDGSASGVASAASRSERQPLTVLIPPPRDPDLVYLTNDRSLTSSSPHSSHSSRSSDLVLLSAAPAASRRPDLRPSVPASNSRFFNPDRPAGQRENLPTPLRV